MISPSTVLLHEYKNSIISISRNIGKTASVMNSIKNNIGDPNDYKGKSLQELKAIEITQHLTNNSIPWALTASINSIIYRNSLHSSLQKKAKRLCRCKDWQCCYRCKPPKRKQLPNYLKS